MNQSTETEKNTEQEHKISLERFKTVEAAVLELSPDLPLHCLRPHTIKKQAEEVIQCFKGKVLYAVKANPHPYFIEALWDGGVRDFDVASISEVRSIRTQFSEAGIHYMNPVKTRSSISEAYFEHNVRSFALDHFSELQKILEETNAASDLTLLVRLKVPNDFSRWKLSNKFGAKVEETEDLLRLARKESKRLGITFHVGSLCTDPEAFKIGIELAANTVLRSQVGIDIVDIGGGFPALYEGLNPVPLESFFRIVNEQMASFPFGTEPEVWCESGRALSAPGASLVVRVLNRRENHLYLNDGLFGSIYGPGQPAPNIGLPTRVVCPNNRKGNQIPFEIFGPTCDGADHLGSPLWLPDDIAEGDWIELGQVGAYGACFRSNFNGFFESLSVVVEDAPLLPSRNLYVPCEVVCSQPRIGEVTAFNRDNSPVSSENEWDPLEEVIIGRADFACLPEYEYAEDYCCAEVEDVEELRKMLGIRPDCRYDQKRIAAANKALDSLAKLLSDEHIKVRRPEKFAFNKKCSSPTWSVRSGYNSCNPRDIFLVLGDTILECPVSSRERYFETWAYKPILKEYCEAGANWVSAPKPDLADALYEAEDENAQFLISDYEPCFDAADFVRCGKDIIGQLSHATNMAGVRWLKRFVENKYDVHLIESLDPYVMHIDTTFIPLAPGRALVNPKYFSMNKVPEVLKKWELLRAPEPVFHPHSVRGFVSPWISMNLLSLDEKRILVDCIQKPLIDSLKDWGFDPIPFDLSSAYAFGGGFHCVSLDIRRRARY